MKDFLKIYTPLISAISLLLLFVSSVLYSIVWSADLPANIDQQKLQTFLDADLYIIVGSSVLFFVSVVYDMFVNNVNNCADRIVRELLPAAGYLFIASAIAVAVFLAVTALRTDEMQPIKSGHPVYRFAVYE